MVSQKLINGRACYHDPPVDTNRANPFLSNKLVRQGSRDAEYVRKFRDADSAPLQPRFFRIRHDRAAHEAMTVMSLVSSRHPSETGQVR